MPSIYKSLIEKCKSNDPQERPSFKEITFELRRKKDFLTDQMNENDFTKYVSYIDENTKIKIEEIEVARFIFFTVFFLIIITFDLSNLKLWAEKWVFINEIQLFSLSDIESNKYKLTIYSSNKNKWLFSCKFKIAWCNN